MSKDSMALVRAEHALLQVELDLMSILDKPMTDEHADRWLAKADALILRAAYLSDAEPVYP